MLSHVGERGPPCRALQARLHQLTAGRCGPRRGPLQVSWRHDPSGCGGGHASGRPGSGQRSDRQALLKRLKIVPWRLGRASTAGTDPMSRREPVDRASAMQATLGPFWSFWALFSSLAIHRPTCAASPRCPPPCGLPTPARTVVWLAERCRR